MKRLALGLVLIAAATVARAQRPDTRTHILIDDTGVIPENIASSRDGLVWFGSVAKGTIYRALPGKSMARPWIMGGPSMSSSMGLYADEPHRLLWVCVPGERGANGSSGKPSAIRTFNLRTGAAIASYAFDGGGRCNDLTIAPGGTVYAGDFDGGRVMRLLKGDTAFRQWVADERLKSADGMAMLQDGCLYLDIYKTGLLFRLAVLADGSAGPPVPIHVDRPLVSPDGMRAVGRSTLLLAEGEGRLTELTVDGDTARARTIRDGLADNPASVTLVGDVAYVVQAQWSAMDKPGSARPFGAIAIPYPHASAR